MCNGQFANINLLFIKFKVFIFQRTKFPLSQADGGRVYTNFGKWVGISADTVLSYMDYTDGVF